MVYLTTKQLIHSAILLTAMLIFQSCSTVKIIPKIEHKKISKKIKTSLPKKFENYDQKSYPNEAFVIANMINVVRPELNEEDRDTIAGQISEALKKHKIEPQIIVSIIDTESNFKSDKVSSTGDISVAQINVEVWNKEFIRMNLPLMIKEQIESNQEYALLKMAEILNIIKQRYEKIDRRWYARYHSNTHRHKSDYLHKLELRLKMLASAGELNPPHMAKNYSKIKPLFASSRDTISSNR